MIGLVVEASSANAVAERLTGRDYLSYSQVSTFQSCPLRWHFQYVAGLRPAFVAAGLVFGSAIHAAIEHHFRLHLAGEPTPTVDDLRLAFDQAWHEAATGPIRYGRDETAASLQALADRMLTTFAADPIAEPDGAVLAIEESLRGPIIPASPDLLGRIDLMVLTPEALVLRDFKTSRSSWTPSRIAGAAPQLRLYGELAAGLAGAVGDRPVRLEFVVLTKHKQPRVEIHAVESDRFEVTRTKQGVRRTWQAMRAGHVYPNPSALHCSACPYQAPCRQWCG